MAFLYYPLYLFIFYYKDLLFGIFNFFINLNRYIASLLSVNLLLRTFFSPLKNEYREGLVGFSRVAGIFLKSILLSVSLMIMFSLFAFEIFFLILVAILPFSFVFLI